MVVSNTAYGLFGAAEEVTDAQIQHQIDTNLLGRSCWYGLRIAAYDASPPHKINHVIDDPSIQSQGDPEKVADAMITSVEANPPPLRLALGSDICIHMKHALATRLAALEAQRDLAFSTDHDEKVNVLPLY